MPQPSILFLGDVACPLGLTPQVVGLENVQSACAVVNLEGAIRPQGMPLPVAGPSGVILYNGEHLLPTLKSWNVQLACLANNHIHDLQRPIQATVDALAAAGIAACGAGDDPQRAAQPAVLDVAGTKLVCLAFGWEVIECRAATPRRGGANPLRPARVLQALRAARATHPDAQLVVMLHWDYELELYPQPAHRQLAHDLIDAGANVVVGHHPHCVQGIEWRSGRPIVYSLGNWFLPHGDWFGRPVAYPDYSWRQLAFAWRPARGPTDPAAADDSMCHWFDYDPATHVIRHVASEPADQSPEAKRRTPFAGMPHRDYCAWFRRHRKKKRGLPIYQDYHATTTNWCYDRWNALRMAALRALRR